MVSIFKRTAQKLISDKKFSEILTGSVWALSARLLATGLGLISSVLIARFYGAEVVGIVAVVNSFLVLSINFTLLGTGTSILRFIPEHLVKYSPTSAFKLYRKTQYLVVAISIVTAILFVWGADFIAEKVFSKPHLSFFFSLAAVFIVFKSMMMLNTSAVRGLRLIRVFVIMQTLPQGLNLLLLVLLGFFWPSDAVPVYALLGGFGMTGIIGWLVMEYCFKKKMQPNETVHSLSIREILSISLPMLMTSSMSLFISQTGVIMLGIFQTESEVGLYAIAARLATLTAFILYAVNSMAGPKFSELFHSNRTDDLFYVARKSAKLIFWSTVPILAGFILFGKQVLRITFGSEFAVAYPALVILVFGQFANSISGATGLFMNMTGNQIIIRNIMIIVVLINLGLNWFLIPIYGFLGAAVSAMVSIAGWNMAALFFIKLKYGRSIGYFPLLIRLKSN